MIIAIDGPAASGKGTLARRVASHYGLHHLDTGLLYRAVAKAVLDAGWSQLRSQLRYKAIRHGAEYVEVDERLTTQVCSACGALGGPKGREDLVVRDWACGSCGAGHDRDINSAINILVSGRNVGLRVTGIPSLRGGEDVNC